MICPHCQTDNLDGADNCENCGAALYGLDLPDAAQGAQSPDFVHEPISSLPKRPIVTIGASDPVGLAVRFMQRQDINCVLVMNGDEVTGILTGWDILQKVAGPTEDLNAVTCGQVMTPSPLTLRDEDTIAVALNAMAAGGFRHVPISNGETPTGFILANDVFRHISPHLV